MSLFNKTENGCGPDDEVPTYPIVFLDIDGVLNSNAYFKKLGRPLYDWDWNDYLNHFDSEAVKLLDQVCKETGAKVVYHTNWRYLFEDPKVVLHGFLTKKGFTGESVGVVPSVGTREQNIAAWLNRYCRCDGDEGDWRTGEIPPNAPPFIAFDDMAHEFPSEFHGRFIWTEEILGRDGLTPQHVEKAVELLKKPLTRDELDLTVEEP